MHVVHLIAVEADDEESAVKAAESAISGYGDGDVWDWYVVGGRWEGKLNGKNVLRFTDDKHTFIEAVNGAIESRNYEFRSLRDHLKGAVIKEDDVDDIGGFGFPIDDKPRVAKLRTEANKGCRRAFNKMLNCDTVEEFEDSHVKGDSSHFMLSYYLRKMGQLLGDRYCFDSMFYDSVDYTTSAKHLWGRLETDPEHQWLVVLDLHN